MNDNFENNKNGYDGYSSDNNTADNNYQDIHSSSDSQSASASRTGVRWTRPPPPRRCRRQIPEDGSSPFYYAPAR